MIQKSPVTPIPDAIHQSVQSINTVLCPDRIKNARAVQITFGYRMEESRLVPSGFSTFIDVDSIEQPQLYSTLPIKDRTGLPFVVNGEWILDMQRDHMTTDSWNLFLLEKLGYYQFAVLRELAKMGYWKDVLTVVGNPQIPIGNFRQAQAYQNGYEEGIREFAWVPARGNPEELLKITNCFVDPHQFLEQFKNDFPLGFVIPRLAHPELRSLDRLQELIQRFPMNVIGQEVIVKYIYEMFQNAFDPKLCYRILKFMITTFPFSLFYGDWIPTGIGKFTSLGQLYFVDSMLDLPPLCVKISCLPPSVFEHDDTGEVKRWFQENRVQLLTPQLIIEEIEKKAGSFSDLESRAVTRYLFDLFVNSKISKEQLEKIRHLKMQSVSGTYALLGTLFLSKAYTPDVEAPLEEIFHSDPGYFLSSNYLDERKEEWAEFFIALGVKKSCSFERYDNLPYVQLIESIDWPLEFHQHLLGQWPRTQNSHQPQIARSVVLIPKISALKTNVRYEQMFWKMVAEQEKSFVPYDQKFTIGAPFAKNVSCLSYLRWVLTTQKVIRSSTGSYENVQDLYSPHFQYVHQIGLPTAAIDVPLSDELVTYLGFKTTLKLAQCFDFLKEMRSKNITDIALYNLIIHNVIKGLSSSESSHRWFFLAHDNTWQSARALKYLGTKGVPLKDRGHHWFKNTNPAIEELAKFLQRPIIKTIVDPQQLQDEELDTGLSDEIERTKLPLLAVVLHQQTMRPFLTCYQSLKEKFKEIHLYEVSKIPTLDNDFMSPDLATSGNKIYYTKKAFRHHLWKEIVSLLVPDAHDLSLYSDILSMASGASNSNHKTTQEWLEEQNLPPDLLSQIQAISSAPKRSAPPLTQHQPPLKKPVVQPSIPVDEDDEPDSNNNALIETATVRAATPRSSTTIRSAPVARSLGHQPSSEEKKAIGRTGEKYAFEALVKHYETKYQASAEHIYEGVAQVVGKEKTVSIRWINAEDETLSPYDIEVNKQLNNLPAQTKFIEVKSTRREETAFFMSEAEMSFLKRNKTDYRLYMVYNAMTSSPTIKKIEKNWLDLANIHERKKYKITLKTDL